MKGYWNNLKSFEKRVVVGIGMVLFVVLNFWLVVPHFSDWGKLKERIAKAQKTLGLFQGEVSQKRRYETMVRDLESEGLSVPPEEQTTAFASAVQAQQVQSGVNIQSSGRPQARTNQFFIEQSQIINVQGKEEQLVNFLYNLGSGNSLIRVRDLTVHPDQTHMQLVAGIKLVASYQKKAAPPRGGSAAPVAAPASPASRTTTAPTPKTGAPNMPSAPASAGRPMDKSQKTTVKKP